VILARNECVVTPIDPVPEELVRFIDANVESVEQLEILRNLGENPGKPWSADELAAASQTQPSRIGAHLTALESRGLLTTQTQDGRQVYRYGPRTVEAEKLLRQLLEFYKERPVTLIKIIYARADDRLKAFADAFRLRKGT
jgi:DNA-binding transcriptional ArsR family regulator